MLTECTHIDAYMQFILDTFDLHVLAYCMDSTQHGCCSTVSSGGFHYRTYCKMPSFQASVAVFLTTPAATYSVY